MPQTLPPSMGRKKTHAPHTKFWLKLKKLRADARINADAPQRQSVRRAARDSGVVTWKPPHGAPWLKSQVETSCRTGVISHANPGKQKAVPRADKNTIVSQIWGVDSSFTAGFWVLPFGLLLHFHTGSHVPEPRPSRGLGEDLPQAAPDESLIPGLNPWLINRGVFFFVVGIHHWREHPTNNGTGLLILGQHYEAKHASQDLRPCSGLQQCSARDDSV